MYYSNDGISYRVLLLLLLLISHHVVVMLYQDSREVAVDATDRLDLSFSVVILVKKYSHAEV